MDPLAIAAAHRAAIAALDAAGDSTHAEVLRTQGTECLRLARLGQAVHAAQGREPPATGDCRECPYHPTPDQPGTNRYGNGG